MLVDHANSTTVAIRCSQDARQTVIEIEDDGDGIFAKMSKSYGTDSSTIANSTTQNLTTSQLQNGYQFESHGTHVTGIILGFAPKAEIIPIQLDEFGGGDQIFVKALRVATLSSARIVNISMRLSRTGRGVSPNVREALLALADSGKLIIIAAGNDGAPLMEYAYTESLVDIAQDPHRPVVKGLAGNRQFDTSCCSDKQLHAQFPLQRLDLRRQRRLGNMHPRRSSAKMQFLGDGNEIVELAQFQNAIS